MSAAVSLLSLVVVALAYGPLVAEFAANQWGKSHYQHFPFIIAASVLLFAQRLAESPPVDGGSARWGRGVGFGAAWVVLLLAYLAASPMLAAASFILLVGAWAAGLTSQLGRFFPLGPWLLLWLVIPPPLGLDQRLIEQLQRTSSRLASTTLDLLGVNHLMDGNALVLPSKQLFVDEACSGIVSVISIVACAAIYGVWRRRRLVHTVALMAAAAGWAMLLNVVRITLIALAEAWSGLNWAEGLPHTLVSLVTFSLSLVTLVATDWLLKALLAEVGPRRELASGEPLHYGAPLVWLWDGVADRESSEIDDDADDELAPGIAWRRWVTSGAAGLGTVPLIVFGGLAATQISMYAPAPFEGKPFDDAPLLARLKSAGAMPEKIGDVTLQDVRHDHRPKNAAFGEHSVIYEYADPAGERYLVSCDFPYTAGWHELATCYVGIGWRLDNRATFVRDAEHSTPPAAGADQYDWVQLELTKPEGSAAIVSFCGWYEDGAMVSAPAVGFWEGVLSAFSRGRVENRHSLQAQVLAVRSGGLTDRDRRISAELLTAARDRFMALTQAD